MFQRLMKACEVLKELIGPVCFVYIGDVVRYAKNLTDNIENIITNSI